jgi:hypothetical protein
MANTSLFPVYSPSITGKICLYLQPISPVKGILSSTNIQTGPKVTFPLLRAPGAPNICVGFVDVTRAWIWRESGVNLAHFMCHANVTRIIRVMPARVHHANVARIRKERALSISQRGRLSIPTPRRRPCTL